MFGCVVASRPLQTDLKQIDETHAYFDIFNASSVNHISVFMLGTVPFPPDYGATVHFFYPGKGFQLLGMLSNDKPSAIFRLRGTFTANNSSITHNTFSSYTQSQPSADVTAMLGLSIEPLAQIQPQMETLASAVSRSVPELTKDPSLLAERIAKHLFNFLSGFVEGSHITPETLVPINVVTKWYESFMNKVKASGTSFLERIE